MGHSIVANISSFRGKPIFRTKKQSLGSPEGARRPETLPDENTSSPPVPQKSTESQTARARVSEYYNTLPMLREQLKARVCEFEDGEVAIILPCVGKSYIRSRKLGYSERCPAGT